jgi:hypothetical protein
MIKNMNGIHGYLINVAQTHQLSNNSNMDVVRTLNPALPELIILLNKFGINDIMILEAFTLTNNSITNTLVAGLRTIVEAIAESGLNEHDTNLINSMVKSNIHKLVGKK